MNLSPELEKPTTDLVTLAAEVRAITSHEELEGANAMIQDIKAMQKQINDFFDPHVKRAHEAHKALTMDRQKFLGPLIHAEGQLKTVANRFILMERQKAEEERQRLEAEARAVEEQRRKVEAERMRKEAEKLRKAGEAEASKALQAEAKAVVAAPIHVVVDAPAAPPLPKGMTPTVRWGFKVVDITRVPLEYLIVNEEMVARIASAMKERMSIPGLEAVKIEGIASRK